MSVPSGSELSSKVAFIEVLTTQESLFYDAQDHKKVKIGEGCRLQLVGYFIDEETAPLMRRWVSSIVGQLVPS